MRRALVLLALALVGSPSGASPPPKPRCLETWDIESSQSPLVELRAMGKPLEDSPTQFRAAKIDERYQPLKSGKPYLYLTPERNAIVVDGRAFSDLSVADPTRMTAGQSAGVGVSHGPKGRELLAFLLRAGVVRSYWHIGATVCLESEATPDGAYEATLSGVHVYYTNRKNEGRFRSRLRVEKDGTITVVGL